LPYISAPHLTADPWSAAVKLPLFPGEVRLLPDQRQSASAGLRTPKQ